MVHIRKSQADGKSILKKVAWYIVFYIRLSKNDENSEDLGVTNQKKILTEYAEEFFQGEYVIAGYYVDDGRAGTDHDHPGFQRMVYDMESGKVNYAIYEGLARVFRNYIDQGCFLKNYSPLHSTHFITFGEPEMDTYLNSEAMNGMEVPIDGLINDRFAHSTSSSIRRTFDTKHRSGGFIGAFAPYRYEKHPINKNALVIDEEAVQAVWNIFRWLAHSGESMKTVVDEGRAEQEVLKGSMSKEGVARELGEMGVPNLTPHRVKKEYRYKNPHTKENDGLRVGASISRPLKNRVYIETMVQREQRVINYEVHDMMNVPEEEWYQASNTREAIIPLELSEKSQELHAKNTRAALGKTETYLFSSFLKCTGHGKSMTRRVSNDFVYYNCPTYKRKSKGKCTEYTMRLGVLEETVLLVIQKHTELVESLEGVLNSINRAPAAQTKSTRLEHLLRLCEQELEKTEDLISGPYINWKNGNTTRGRYREMKEKFGQQEEQLKGVIEHIRDEIGTVGSGTASDNPYLQAFLKHRDIQELSQRLLVELVGTVFIHEDGEITV